MSTATVCPSHLATRSLSLTQTVAANSAYFGCIKQLIGLLPFPCSEYDSTLPPLFVIGDSHCLSVGWRVVTYRGRRRLLRPMLVTGLKCCKSDAVSVLSRFPSC